MARAWNTRPISSAVRPTAIKPASARSAGAERVEEQRHAERLAAHRRMTQVVEAPIEAQRLAKVQRRENEHAGEQDELNENEDRIGAGLGQRRETVEPAEPGQEQDRESADH